MTEFDLKRCPTCGGKLRRCECGEIISITCNFCYSCGTKLEQEKN